MPSVGHERWNMSPIFESKCRLLTLKHLGHGLEDVS